MYKILICDDERDIRNALRIYLTGEGYAVCEADSGLAALELMQREEVQLVLMDIMMPEMDGQQAVSGIRALEESRGIVYTDGAKVIMTSALGDVKNVSTAYGHLCDAYLVKPIYKQTLLDELRKLGLID